MKRNLSVGFFAAVMIALCLYVNGQIAFERKSISNDGARSEAPQAIIVEDFSYATGALTSGTGGGANTSGGNWVNFSGTGNFIPVSSGSLSFTGYPSSGVGNKIDIISVGTSAEDAYRQFGIQGVGTTTYAAFMVNVANTTGLSVNSSTTGDYFAGFLPSTSTTLLNARVSIRQGPGTGFNLGLRATSANATATFGAAELATGTTHLVVISYQVVAGEANDVVRMWINPVITGAEPAADITQTTATATDIVEVARFFVRQGTTTTPNASLDGVRVGTSWADLTAGVATLPKVFETYFSGANEVPPNASTGRGHGRVVLNAAETQITASAYWQGLGSNTVDGHIHGPAGPGANAAPIFGLSVPTGATSGVAENRVFPVTPQQVADLKAGLWYINIHSASIPAGEIRGQLAPARAPVDFNGDGKTDYSVVRSTGGQKTWYNLLNGPKTATGVAWGAGSDIETPEDFDGDNKTDIAVWRTGAQGRFFIINSSTGTTSVVDFGQTGDDPRVVGDYDGDGRADLAVYRAGATAGQASHWWYRRSTVGGAGCTAPGACNDVTFGQNGDVPAPGDYDGDGRNDFVVRRPDGGGNARFWMVTAAGVASNAQFGGIDDLIVPGDWDGDGKTDIAVARNVGGVGNWFWRPSGGGSDVHFIWGDATQDEVCHGDYDGDGRTDACAWRNGNFFIRGSSSGPIGVPWGAAGDFVTASFNTHGNN